MMRSQSITDLSTRNVISSPYVLLLLLVLVSVGAWAEQCSFTNSGRLSVRHRTNATGHPQLNVRLEQPTDAESWQMDIELGTSSCSDDGSQRKILVLNVNGDAWAAAPARGPPAGYVRLQGLGFFREGARVAEWAEARDACAAEGAELAMPASTAEAHAVAGAFPYNATGASYNKLVWLGASDIQQENKFVTLAGVPLESHGYNTWTPNQPAGKTSENCLAFWASSALLEDVSCNSKLPYVCKFS